MKSLVRGGQLLLAIGVATAASPQLSLAQEAGQTFRVVYECTDFASCWASCSSNRAAETATAEQTLRSRDQDDPALQFRFVQVQRIFWGQDPAYLNPPIEGPVLVRFLWSVSPVPDRAADPTGFYAVSHELSMLVFDPDLLNCQFNNMTVVQF